MGQEADGSPHAVSVGHLFVRHRRLVEDICRQSGHHFKQCHLRRRGRDVLVPGVLLNSVEPLLYLYPPEVMNYSMRANGLAFSQFLLQVFA